MVWACTVRSRKYTKQKWRKPWQILHFTSFFKKHLTKRLCSLNPASMPTKSHFQRPVLFFYLRYHIALIILRVTLAKKHRNLSYGKSMFLHSTVMVISEWHGPLNANSNNGISLIKKRWGLDFGRSCVWHLIDGVWIGSTKGSVVANKLFIQIVQTYESRLSQMGFRWNHCSC